MFSNRPGTKLFTAVLLLAGAAALSLSFRRDPARPARPPATKTQPLVLRETPPPADVQIVRPDAPTAEIQPTLLAPPPRGVVESDRTEAEWARLAPPPMMARTFPNLPVRSAAESEPGLQIAFNRDRRPLERFHRVRDGDTLEKLAERYLGDRSRWHEIYQCNSRVIERPDLLPLGTRLRIPPKHARGPQDRTAAPLRIIQAPLVSLSPETDAP
jgi:nucleoid-associated protein YgaU